MDRRRFLLTSLAGALAAPPGAGAQPSRNVRVIGFLGPPPSAGGLVQAFQQGLRDLGYVDGQNIRIGYRYTLEVSDLATATRSPGVSASAVAAGPTSAPPA